MCIDLYFQAYIHYTYITNHVRSKNIMRNMCGSHILKKIVLLTKQYNNNIFNKVQTNMIEILQITLFFRGVEKESTPHPTKLVNSVLNDTSIN